MRVRKTGARLAVDLFTLTAAAVAATAFFGCSLDYRGAGYDEKLAETTPDTVLYDFSTTSMHGKVPYIQVTAAKAETFEKKNLTILDGLRFTQFDSNGDVAASGSADHADYHTDSQDADLSGNIDVYSSQEHARITADWLSWDDDAKTLTGRADGTVAVKKDSGSSISGQGFEAELKTRTIKFSGGVRGSWVADKNN
jgi:LPS export ABC transporter protein LptC